MRVYIDDGGLRRHDGVSPGSVSMSSSNEHAYADKVLEVGRVEVVSKVFTAGCPKF